MSDEASDLRDVYKGTSYDSKPIVFCVCCIDSEWREAQRVQTDKCGSISYLLIDSRLLFGKWSFSYIGMCRVDSGPRIAPFQRIYMHDKFNRLSATWRSDTHVPTADGIPEYRQLSASAFIVRRPAGGTRAHSIEVSRIFPAAC